MRLADTARFKSTDHELLVRAAFACAICLRTVPEARITGDPGMAIASCPCERCHAVTEVALDDLQYLRLVIAPIPGLKIRLGAVEL